MKQKVTILLLAVWSAIWLFHFVEAASFRVSPFASDARKWEEAISPELARFIEAASAVIPKDGSIEFRHHLSKWQKQRAHYLLLPRTFSTDPQYVLIFQTDYSPSEAEEVLYQDQHGMIVRWF